MSAETLSPVFAFFLGAVFLVAFACLLLIAFFVVFAIRSAWRWRRDGRGTTPSRAANERRSDK
jgi:hypothetical protein